jgi:hypothetical protein
MKNILCLLLLFTAFNASAIDINKYISGSWYNPAQDGHGINIEVINEKKMVVYWYAYHTDGTPMWLVTIARWEPGSNVATGATYYNTGMTWGEFDPNDRAQTPWGTSTITFHNCNSATLQYEADEPSYGSGTIPMERLTFVAGVKCSDSTLHGIYHGTWLEPGEIGFGLALFFGNGDLVYHAVGVDGSSAEVGTGDWWTTGANTFAFDATAFSAFGGLLEFEGSGTFDEDAIYSTYYDGTGEFVGTPIPSFQYNLTTSKIAGNYTIFDWTDAEVGSATLESNGAVSGSMTNGCQFSGSINVPNTNFNQAYIDLDVTNCVSTTQITGGVTFNNAENSVVVTGTDGWYGYYWVMR